MSIGAFKPTPYGKQEDRFAFVSFTVSSRTSKKDPAAFIIEALQDTGFIKSALIELEFDTHGDQLSCVIKGSDSLIEYLQNAAEITSLPVDAARTIKLTPRQADEFLTKSVNELEEHLVQSLIKGGYEPLFATGPFTSVAYDSNPEYDGDRQASYLRDIASVEQKPSLAKSFAHAIGAGDERSTFLDTGLSLEPPEHRHFSYAVPILIDANIYLLALSWQTESPSEDVVNALYSLPAESEAYQAIRASALELMPARAASVLPDELVYQLQETVLNPLQMTEGGLSAPHNPLFVMALTATEFDDLADYAEIETLALSTSLEAVQPLRVMNHAERNAFARGELVERPMDCETIITAIDDLKHRQPFPAKSMSL
tara:strand:+ start:737 stop:1849 length:1113 start_codon:yes stop_codon:yes gene_type:complete